MVRKNTPPATITAGRRTSGIRAESGTAGSGAAGARNLSVRGAAALSGPRRRRSTASASSADSSAKRRYVGQVRRRRTALDPQARIDALHEVRGEADRAQEGIQRKQQGDGGNGVGQPAQAAERWRRVVTGDERRDHRVAEQEPERAGQTQTGEQEQVDQQAADLRPV